MVDAEPVDQRQVLIDAFDAERPGVVDRTERDRPAVDEHLPGIGLVIAGQDLDQGRFAGAVVAEDAERLAARDPERHAGERSDLAEHLDQFFGADRVGRGSLL